MDIPLTQGKFAKIDPEDWPLVSRHTWHAKLENGYLWYAATTIQDPVTRQTVHIRMHRLIMGAGPDEMVDHIASEETLDNRRSNLRLCSNPQNQQNSGSRGGASPFKGVSWYARKKKRLVQFRCDGVYRFVGYFDDEVEAARAYDAAIAPLAGEFARLNFPMAA